MFGIVFLTVFSLKSIYLVPGFAQSTIYSMITNRSLYPECPLSQNPIIIQTSQNSNQKLISQYPNCSSKLFQLQLNKKTNCVEQLSGIKTSSLNLESPIFSGPFKEIYAKITEMGYQEDVNIFNVDYNFYFHPITSFSVYEKLKVKIEENYKKTEEKAFFISFGQGSSFLSIFLSNFSSKEWVKKYIDCAIFIAPTFSGLSTFNKLDEEKINPLLMRMPGIQIMLPNYGIYGEGAAKSIIDRLMRDGKIDDESLKIYKLKVEQYVKHSIPEPPVPSLIIYNDGVTTQGQYFSHSGDGKVTSEGAKQACSEWKSSKCLNFGDFTTHDKILQSEKTVKTVYDFVKGRQVPKSRQISPKSVPEASFGSPSGNYADMHYIASHRVLLNEFQYDGPEGTNGKPLSNAFDGNRDTYYISSQPVNETEKTVLTINFREMVTLEAMLYDTSYHTRGETRNFDGFPTRLNVYASINGSPDDLVAVFTGTPVYPMTRIQFVFPNKVVCDKLILEYVEVTEGKTNYCVAIGDLMFISTIPGFIQMKAASGNYANQNFVNSHKIPQSKFTFDAPNGVNQQYRLDNLFDGYAKQFYMSSVKNTEFDHTTITVSFNNKAVELDAILMDSSYNTSNNKRTFQGFPLIMKVYYSSGNNPPSLAGIFQGNPSYPDERMQLVFPTAIVCDKLYLEPVVTTIQTFSGTDERLFVGGFILISKDMASTPISAPTGNFANNDYINKHKVLTSEFTYEGTQEKPDYPLSNMFDNNAASYYISELEDTNTQHTTVTVTFKQRVILEGFLYDTSYKTDGNSREYLGFPRTLNIYTTLDDVQHHLVAVFKGNPAYPMTRIQYVFNLPVVCDKIHFEFCDVTVHSLEGNKKTACVAELTFIKIEYDQMSEATGDLIDPDYIKGHQIKSFFFPDDSPAGLNNTIYSNAFDDDPSSYFDSADKFAFKLIFLKQFHGLTDILIDNNPISKIGYSLQPQGFPKLIKIVAYNNQNPVFSKFYHMETLIYAPRIRLSVPNMETTFDQFEIYFDFPTKMFYSTYISLKHIRISNIYLISRTNLPATPIPTMALPTPHPYVPVSPPSDFPTEEKEIENLCQIDNVHCNVDKSQEQPITLLVTKTGFNNVQDDGDGGAIRLVNSALKCENISFVGCKSLSGGGGGIYINNAISSNNQRPAFLQNLNFDGCTAMYGGAVFIHTESFDDQVLINYCSFSNCIASRTKKDSMDSLYGGSALFLIALSSSIISCKLSKNVGEIQFKIYNRFEQIPHAKLLNRNPLNLIEDCLFELNENIDSSLFYISGENGVKFIVRNCEFKGVLASGADHIKGMTMNKMAPKLKIESCSFSSGRSYDRTSFDFLDLDDNQMKKLYSAKSSKINCLNPSFFGVFVGFLAVCLALLLFIVLKKNNSSDNSSPEYDL